MIGEYILPQKETFVHQIVTVQLKILHPQGGSLAYHLKGGKNIQIRYIEPSFHKKGLYSYKKIAFKILGTSYKLPDVSITFDGEHYNISGPNSTAQKLHPPKNFSHVLAKSLQIVSIQAARYDDKTNALLLHIKGEQANVEDFTLPKILKGSLRQLHEKFPYEEAEYYALLPISFKKLIVSYFDTTHDEYRTIPLRIEIKQELTTTQTNLAPKEDPLLQLKGAIALAIGTVLALYMLWKKRIFLSLIGFILVGWGVYALIPLQKACVRSGAKILLLPTKNTTVFKVLSHRAEFTKLGHVDGYVKIKLDSKHIGWIKDEDLCQN